MMGMKTTVISGLLLVLIMVPFFLDPALVFVLTAQIFAGAGVLSWIAFFLLTTTPGPVFFEAKMGKKIILFNPRNDRFADFSVAKKTGGLHFVKGKGIYDVSQDDIYIETSSRVPIATVYDTFALSMGADDVQVRNALKAAGYTNYRDMIMSWNAYESRLNAWGKDKSPDRKDPPEPPAIIIMGKSVNLADVIQYFGANERADVIEAQMMNVSAAERSKKGGSLQVGGIITIIAILLIVGALAYAMINATQKGSIDTGAIASQISSQVKVLSTTPTTIPQPTGIE